MKNEINVEIGQQIKAAREAARLTQEQLAEILDCTPQYVSMMENGRYGISIKMLRKLCLKLNITSDSILFPGSDNPTMDMINYKSKNLSDEQLHQLMQINVLFIEAVTPRK